MSPSFLSPGFLRPSVPVLSPAMPLVPGFGMRCGAAACARGHTLTPEQRKAQIETMLQRARNWPNLKFEMEQGSNVHWVGAGPPLHQHERGCPTFRGFRKVGTHDRWGSLVRGDSWNCGKQAWASPPVCPRVIRSFRATLRDTPALYLPR